MVSGHINASVTIVGRGTVNKYGEFPKDGTSTGARAFVREKRGVTRTRDGQEIVYDKEFWLDSSETIALNDKIIHGSITHEIIAIRTGADLYGNGDYFKVFVRLA